MLEDWEKYLDRLIAQTDQEHHNYVYPVKDWNPEEENQEYNAWTKVKKEKAVISKLLEQEWHIALDFGCGGGAHFHLFDQETKETRLLIGIDPDCSRANLARIAVKKFLQHITGKVVCGSIEVLQNAPLGLSVDRILCAQVLGHVAEEQLIRTLRGFHRVLAPTGRCAILVPVIGETFTEHPYHAAGWNGKDDYTHIVNCNTDSLEEFRKYVSLEEYTNQANNPVEYMLPVRSYLLPEFPDPATFQTPGSIQTIPPTIERVIQRYFMVEETVLYAIHRDTPEANWPVADIIMFLKKR